MSTKGFKLTVKGKHKTASEYLHENHGTLSLPSDPAPSSLPLQGGKGFSCSSSELSSSEGVWQPRKGEKMRKRRGKRKEAGIAERFLSILLIDGSIPFTDLDSSLYTAQSKGNYKKKN